MATRIMKKSEVNSGTTDGYCLKLKQHRDKWKRRATDLYDELVDAKVDRDKWKAKAVALEGIIKRALNAYEGPYTSTIEILDETFTLDNTGEGI